MNKIESVGGLLGRFDKSSVEAYRLALLLNIESAADISQAGLLVGSVSGTLNVR